MLLNDLTESQAMFAKDSLPVMDMAEKILSQKFKNAYLIKPFGYLVCSSHIKKLLEGYVLSYSEMVDLCTLRDDAAQVLGYRTGLEVIFRNSKEIETVQPIINRIWRRILLATEYFISLF